MNLLSAKEAADKLGIDSSRIRQFILEGRLPAQKIGNSYAINEADLTLVAERKPGRPKKTERESETPLAPPPDPPFPRTTKAKSVPTAKTNRALAKTRRK